MNVPFSNDFTGFRIGLVPISIAGRPTGAKRWKPGTNPGLGAQPSNLVLNQYESPKFLNQNVGWKPVLGNYFDSSFFPTIFRAFVLPRNPFRIAGRRRVSNPSKTS